MLALTLPFAVQLSPSKTPEIGSFRELSSPRSFSTEASLMRDENARNNGFWIPGVFFFATCDSTNVFVLSEFIFLFRAYSMNIPLRTEGIIFETDKSIFPVSKHEQQYLCGKFLLPRAGS
mmetsp:Transcript_1119/g.1208  ORF Transcript_1119/g.1208 Transcript_1119/m.1208 type:complete len:120 (-) Transcript_1119:107-466(-)